MKKHLAWLLMFPASVLIALAHLLDEQAGEAFTRGLVQYGEDFDPAPPRE